MSREGPPERKKARSERQFSNRDPENQIIDKTVRKITDQLPPIKKRLLQNWGTTWLFEATFTKGVKFWVEQGDKRGEFTLLYSAQGKFERLARLEGWTE